MAFDGSEEAAQRRLRKLVDNRYLNQGQQGLLKRIYWLNTKGIEAIVEYPKRGELKHTQAPSWTKANHDVLTGEVQCVVREAAHQREEVQFDGCISEREMRLWKDAPVSFRLASGKTEKRQVCL